MSLLAILAARSAVAPVEPDPDPETPVEPDPTLDTYAPVMTAPRWSRLSAAPEVDTTWQAPLEVTTRAQVFDLVYSAYDVNSTATIAAAIEHEGQVYPASFDGQARVTISGTGATQWATGRVTLPSPLPAGTTVRVRTFAAAGSTVMAGASGQGGPAQFDTGDKTLPGSEPITVNTGVHRTRITPVAVLGNTVADTISVAGLGDSIMEGGADGPYQGIVYGQEDGGGFFTRAVRSAGVPAACFGVWADNFPANPATDRRFGGLLEHFTHAVCEYGTNALPGIVLHNGGDWKVLGRSGLNFWTWVANQDVKVAQTTLTPKVNSTDGYTTIEGQTASGVEDGTEAVRLGFNAWVRDQCPIIDGQPVDPGTSGAVRAGDDGHPLVGVIDTNAAVMAKNSLGHEVFDVDPGGVRLTVDQAHPAPAGHRRMAVPVAAWIESQK